MTATTPAIPAAHDSTLPLDEIAPNPANPRRNIDEATLAELAESIRRHGLLQPILVQRRFDTPSEAAAIIAQRQPGYQIVAGERRWRACKLAGLAELPVRVLPALGDAEALELALVENLQRHDLNPIEAAEGYRRLHDDCGLKQREIADRLNRSQPAIANALRLLTLPDDVQQRLGSGELSAAHGVALARYAAFPALASHLAALTIQHGWTSKRCEGPIHEEWQVHQTANSPSLPGAVRKRLVQPLYESGSDVPLSTCRACPFDAYRGDTHVPSRGYCLRPDHYDELVAAAAAARQVRVQAAIAAAEAAGEAGPLTLADLRWGEYEHLWGKPPAGCDTSCPCHAMALNRDGEPVPICTDPKRLSKLRATATRAETKATKQRQASDHAALAGRLDDVTVPELPEPAHRLLVVVAAAALSRVSDRAALMTALPRAGAALDGWRGLKDYEISSLTGKRGTYADLAGLSSQALLLLAGEALLGSDLARRTGPHSQTPLANWFLDEGSGVRDQESAEAEGAADAE